MSENQMLVHGIFKFLGNQWILFLLSGSDPEGSKVIYSISGEYFTVDQDTGIVSTLKSFDREKEDIVSVVISVTGESLEFWNKFRY